RALQTATNNPKDDSSGSDKYDRLLNQMLNDRMSKLIHFTQKIKVSRGECEARYIDGDLAVSSALHKHHFRWSVNEPREMAFSSWVQFMGGAGIRFWDGDRESAAEIRGTFEEIKDKFAEIYPIAHLVDTINQALENWDIVLDTEVWVYPKTSTVLLFLEDTTEPCAAHSAPEASDIIPREIMTTLIIRALSFVLTLAAVTLALQANPKEPKGMNVYVQVANLASEVTKLSKQVSKLTGLVSSQTNKLSKLMSFSRKIEAQPKRCVGRYVDGDITVSWEDDIQTVSWRVTDPLQLYFSASIRPSKWTTILFQDPDREGEIKANLIDMPSRVANIFPLSNNLTDIIMKVSTTDPKDDVTCTLMIDLLERTPPEGYQAGWDWMKRFLNDKMAKALQLAGDVGKLKSI
ncbi:hypothetical protein FOZ63_033027, partial [Perkinsus olseni]